VVAKDCPEHIDGRAGAGIMAGTLRVAAVPAIG